MAFKLIQDKFDMRAVLLDRAGLDESFHAQLALVGVVAHAPKLGDGHVIALVGAVSGIREPADGAQNDGNRSPDSQCVSGELHGQLLTIRALAGGVNQ
jgi:hypothetical protein